MARKIVSLSGLEINERVIIRMKQIAKEKNWFAYYDVYYKPLRNVQNLSNIYAVAIEQIHVVLGKDWFFCYAVHQEYLELLDWATMKSDALFLQTCEMLKALQNIVNNHSEKYIVASIRHSMAFPFYEAALCHGLIEPMQELYFLDWYTPSVVENIVAKYGSLERFLNENGLERYPLLGVYLLHDVQFRFNPCFSSSVSKNEVSLQKRVRNKFMNIF